MHLNFKDETVKSMITFYRSNNNDLSAEACRQSMPQKKLILTLKTQQIQVSICKLVK